MHLTKSSFKMTNNSFFSFLKKSLFIYLFLAALVLRCCAWAFSSCSERGLLFVVVHGLLIAVASFVVEHGFQARRLQQLWHTASVVVARELQSAGSVVVAHRLSCSMACGILPDQGSNPCPLHWQVDSKPLRHQGSPNSRFFYKVNDLEILRFQSCQTYFYWFLFYWSVRLSGINIT